MKTSIRSSLKAFLVLTSVFAISACGSGSSTANVNPVDLFDASTTAPSLDAIIPANSNFNTTLPVQGFTTANPRFIFSSVSFYGGSYLAPGAGIVTDVGATTLNGVTLTYVRILHTGLLSTIVYGIQLPNVRPGDGVVSGQIIGNYVSSGQVGFEVRVRDQPVCPLSYLSTAFRLLLSSQTYYQNLCL